MNWKHRNSKFMWTPKCEYLFVKVFVNTELPSVVSSLCFIYTKNFTVKSSLHDSSDYKFDSYHHLWSFMILMILDVVLYINHLLWKVILLSMLKMVMNIEFHFHIHFCEIGDTWIHNQFSGAMNLQLLQIHQIHQIMQKISLALFTESIWCNVILSSNQSAHGKSHLCHSMVYI